MRNAVIAMLAIPALLLAGAYGYRAIDRDHRYNELVKLADSLAGDGHPLEALRTYGIAIALAPEAAIAYVKRADAYRSQGNLPAAIADLETAGSLEDDVLLVSTRLGDLCYQTERFDEAARHYQRVLALDSNAPAVLYKLGLVHFRAGREAEAIEALNRAASLGTGFWEALYLRGAVFRSIGGLVEAERDFRAALDLNPEAELPRAALIELYLDQQLASKAMPLVEEEIRAQPDRARPYLHLADAHFLDGRTTQAIEAVSLALEKDPNLPAAYLRLGELWLEEGGGDDAVAAEKALAALTSVVKMDPTSGAAALALGRAYLSLGDEERGLSELLRASQSTPVQAEAFRLLGDLYRTRRNPAEAVTAYHVYLKLSGDTPAVLERLGDAYLENGNPAMGAETYMRQAALEPRRVVPLQKAARAYLLSGDPTSATRACRRGLASNPENPVLLKLLDEARGASAARARTRTEPGSP
jgi:tetratricopeptide (TPR) repeat protein